MPRHYKVELGKQYPMLSYLDGQIRASVPCIGVCTLNVARVKFLTESDICRHFGNELKQIFNQRYYVTVQSLFKLATI